MELQSAFMATAAAAVLFFAILRERRDAAAWLFAALVAAFGCFSLGRASDAEPIADLALVALSWLVPLSTALLAGDPVRPATWRMPQLLAFAVPAGIGVALAGGVLPRGPSVAGLLVCLLAGLAQGARSLGRASRQISAADAPGATRLRYLALCQWAVACAVAIDVIADRFDKPRIASYAAALFYLYAGYLHLVEVRVKDLRQLMGNAVALTLMAAGLAGTFAVLWVWVGSRLDAFAFNAFVASFLVLLFLEPAKARIQGALDRYFVAGRFELERAFRPLLERLPLVLTLDEFLRLVLEATESTGRLRASAIYLCDDPHVGFQQVGSFGMPQRRRVHLMRAPSWVEALEGGTALQREELERARDHPRAGQDVSLLEALRRTLSELDAQLVLPLRTRHRLLGFWTLADENSREPFSTPEIELLSRVADQMAVTIDNTKTFERVRARDRLAMLGEVSAGLAHEVRNPLATIRGSLALLDDPDPQTSAEIRKGMIEEIDRLDRLVDTFLNYARPSTEHFEISDLAGFVRSCIDTVTRAQAERGVRLRFTSEPGLPAITANPDQLERVITNVVQNAYEAVADDGEIEVFLRRSAADAGHGAIEIAVLDNGPGFDEEALEKAFIPFFTTKHTGTGLGLPLCERLLRAQGGTIRLISRPGEKTKVLIRLPLRARPEGDAIEESA
jgi:two-component system, NtrC family, sensor histidine kinase HydH